MNARGKTVDTTYLSLDTAEERGFIHRDYIAHCLRWSHVIKFLTRGKLYEKAKIIDVGCGREVPLAKTMYSSRLIAESYHAIDYGPIPAEARAMFHTGKFPIQFHENTDFSTWARSIPVEGKANLICCFEVLEHVEPKHMIAMLRAMQTVLEPNGTIFISTPCWDVVSCAANHVNEMRYEALGRVLEELGFVIRNVYGTFASIKDIEPYMTPNHREVFEDMRDYYDVNYLATIMAPFYPQYSRNCLWELQVSKLTENSTNCEDDVPHMFNVLESVPEPWSSSANWRDMCLTS